METKSPQSRLHEIAALTLEAVNRLSQEGSPLDVDTLAASLSASEELKDLSAPPSTAENFFRNETLRLKKELETLQNKYKKIDANRRDLSGQLDRAERISTRSGDFIRRAVPALAELARSGEGRNHPEPLDRITELLKTDAPLEEIETVFQRLKKKVFRVELKKNDVTPSPSKASSILNLFKRPASSEAADHVSLFRESYTSIVEELRLNLDQTAMSELAEIKSLLSGVLQVDDFHAIRKRIMGLLMAYISRVSTERAEAAAFIIEIGELLLEIEKQVIRSITATQETRDANTRLTNSIEEEMDSFQETVDSTRSLEDLKSRIMDRITAIKKVIENNRQEDLPHDIFTDQEVAVLKNNLNRMKTEVQSAKKRSQVLEAELMSDPLTQVYNRRAYNQRIADELERFHRYQTTFSMLLLDVDHFKNINDRYGHSVGDLCLKEIINRIRPLIRKTDFLGRYGGEEFVIILPETGRDGAKNTAEKIRLHIEKTVFLHKGENVKVTISLGATQVKAPDKSPEEIFERVDKAMYQAKQSGRNRVVLM